MQPVGTREEQTLKLLEGRSTDPPAAPLPTPTPMPTRHPLEGLGPVPLPGETQLRNRALLLDRTQRLTLLAAVVVPLLLLIAVAIFAPEQLGEKLRQDLSLLWSICLGVVFGVLNLLLASRQRLFIGPGGLRYYSGVPSWLGPLRGDWSVSAEQIRDIQVSHHALGATPHLLQLVIETEGKTRRLPVFHWVDPTRYDRRAFQALAGLRPDRDAIARLFDTLPLVEYARGRGYTLQMPDATHRSANPVLSLEKKPRIVVASTFVFVGVTYAVIDMGVISETYAAGTPIWMILAGGGATGILAWLLLGTTESSGPVRGVVALLVALATMAALYPGLIRINRVGAPDPQPYAYRHTDEGILAPVEPTSPQIDLPEIVNLLIGSQPGDVHELWIRHGCLGFDQVDIHAFEDWIDEFAKRDT